MNSGGGIDMQSVQNWERSQSIKMNMPGKHGKNEDDSVEALIAKLNMKGTKVKIVKDGEEEINANQVNGQHNTPVDIQRMKSVKKVKGKKNGAAAAAPDPSQSP